MDSGRDGVRCRVSRRGAGGQSPDPGGRDVVQQARYGLPDGLFEVVADEAGLVDRVRPLVAELVGLPDRLDEFLHPPVDTPPIRLGGSRVAPGCGGVGDLAQLLEDRAAGGLGRMGGEDRLQHRAVDQRYGFGRRDSRLDQRDEALLESPFERVPLGVQILHTVDLLGHVGEMEVDGEGLRQL